MQKLCGELWTIGRPLGMVGQDARDMVGEITQTAEGGVYGMGN